MLDEKLMEVDHLVIDSHDSMVHVVDDDYIHDIALDNLDIVMEISYNGSKGLDIDFDLEDSKVELNQVQDDS